MACTESVEIAKTREQILDLTQEDKLRYFHSVTVQHPRMDQALQDILLLSAPNTGTDIILLIGPAGAGKSATIEIVRRKFLEVFAAQMRSDRGFIPIACIEAPSSGEVSFSWRILYSRIGDALGEPLLQRKSFTVAERNGIRVGSGPHGSTVAALRVAIEHALRHRRTRLLVIDEAAHVLANCGDAKLISHMNALKSLANVSGVTLVLVGSYDLHRLPMLSGQLARRTAVIHLSRYRVGEQHEEQCFRRTLRTLQRRLPLQTTPDLEPYSAKLQTACVGCVGTLKETLMRALAMTLQSGGHWKDEYLRRALLSEAALTAILEETLAGEKMLSRGTYGNGCDLLQSA
jgi:hypothetical protein